MTEEGKKYLSDISRAIDLIESFTEEINDFDTYDSDLKTQSATERQLAIIGEALNKLKRAETDKRINHEKQIIAFRNRLIHGYDSVDNSIVWTILQKYLPKLKSEIEQF
jgi:uncharacterized protein with HEPN domain